jgi:hypothetical protein
MFTNMTTKYGLLVIMGALLFCKQGDGVRIPGGPLVSSDHIRGEA